MPALAIDIEKDLKKNLSTARVTELQIQAENRALNQDRAIREKVRETLGIGTP